MANELYQESCVLLNQDKVYNRTMIYTGRVVSGTNGVNLQVHRNGAHVATRRLAGAARGWVLAQVINDDLAVGADLDQLNYDHVLAVKLSETGWTVIAGITLPAPTLTIAQIDYTHNHRS